MPPPDSGRRGFHTTRWSLVRATAGTDPEGAREALASLCDAYWYPLYAYVRRYGHSPEDAQDLTQAFFARLLERQDFASARPDRGRLRAFLLGSLKHFLINDSRDRAAHKRGGGQVPVSLDAERAEGRYGVEPVDARTPEDLYERRWALNVLERALERVRVAWERDGRLDRFSRLQACLTGEPIAGGSARLARDLGISDGAVKVAVHRLRQEYGRAVRAEVADTVDDPAAVDEEVRELTRIVGAV